MSPPAAIGTPFAEIRPPLCPAALDMLSGLGFTHATPVQAATIPLLTTNKDVAVEAITGSGKTLAFVLAAAEILRRLDEPLKDNQVGAVILSPTRELAKQTYDVAAPFFAAAAGAGAQLLVGGTDITASLASLTSSPAHVLIGTPGRLDDCLKRCETLDLRRVEILILDEADRLLALGFQKQIAAITARLPKQRRTGLFSATQTQAVAELTRAGLRNPVRVAVRQPGAPGIPAGPSGDGGGTAVNAGAGAVASATPAGLICEYLLVEEDAKLPALLSFLRGAGRGRKCIAYFLTCAAVDYYAGAMAALASSPVPGLGAKLRLPPVVTAIHGKLKQSRRDASLAAFAASPASAGALLLATDVAARGLDLPDVDWVIQFDPPQDPDAFIHRVGRTARAGRPGRALALLTPAEAPYVQFLALRRVPLSPHAPQVTGGTGAVTDPGAETILAALAAASAAAREQLERGSRAFVAHVRAYSEHQCRFIFRPKALHLGRLARAFGLLRLPKMPEIRKAGGMAGSLAPFVPSAIDPSTVRYADRAREKQRQRAIAAAAGGEGSLPPPRGGGGTGAITRAGPGRTAETAPSTETGRRVPADKRRKREARDDAAELDSDYRLLVKLRRGRITEAECDESTGLGLLSGAGPGENPVAVAGGGAEGRPASAKNASARKKNW